MSRPLRISYPGAWYHIHHKTLKKRPLFPGKQYRTAFYDLLQEITNVYGIEIHGYCLLDHEFHLLVRTPDPRLSEAMRHLLSLYTARYNRLQESEGPLFKGRYKSVLIENDMHVVQASRYIHRLPKDIAQQQGNKNYCLSLWKDSSYRAYIGTVKPQQWLNTKQVLEFFANQNGAALYQIYVDTGQDIETDSFYHKKRISPVMGSGDFKRKLSLTKSFDQYDTDEVPDAKTLNKRPEITEIIEKVAGFFETDEKQVLVSPRGRGKQNIPRSIAITLSRNIGGYSLKAIAKAFGVGHYSTISVAISRLNNILLDDDQLRINFETLRSQLMT